MPSRVSIDVVAHDNASSTLDSVRSKLVLFDQFGRQASDLTEKVERSGRSFEMLDISASKAARGIRTLVAPIAQELSPALGQFGSQMAGVISTAAVLGSGMGALAIGAASLAGLVGGRLVASFSEATERKRAFDEALRTGDIAKTTAEIAKMAKELDDLGKIRLLQQGGPMALQVERDVAARRAERLGQIREQAVAGEFGELRRAQLEDAQAMKAREDLLEGQRLRLHGADLARTRRGLDNPTLDAIERARQEKLLAADDLQFRQEQPEAAQRARARAQAEYAEALRQRHLAFLKGDVAGYDEALGYGAITPQFLEEQERISGRIASERLARRFEAEPPPDFDEARGYGAITPEFLTRQKEISERITTEELQKQLDLTQQLAVQNATRTDLTLEQRENLSLQAIELERILKLQLAGNDQAKQFAAEIEAQIKRQQVLEATDPIAGFRRGLTDVEVEFGSAGLRMQSLAHEMGGGMARALDDSFFDVVTGNFKDLPDVARRFTQDMVRAVTGELSKLLTSQIVGQVKNLFGGDTVGSLPFGLGSGGAPLLTAAGRPLSESEIATAYAAGGEAGVRALRAGEATVVGGEFIATGTGLEQVSAGAGIRTTAAPSGFTVRQGLGIAGSAALLGLTAYGARGAQTNFDVGTSAAMGALTGATLGGQIGGAFGYQGAGTAVGAVLGAAINGTIAALAKQEADKEARKAKQAAELERAAGAGSDLVRSAAGATSVSDLFRRITAAGSGYTGGTANPAVSTTVQTPTGPRPIGIENPTYPVATLQDLLASPQSLQANIQAGVDPSALAGPNAATSEALRAIAGDLVAQFREAEMGVGLTQEDRLGGLTRRTTYPASRADMLDPTRGVEVDELALSALSDDDRAVLLLDVMGRVAVEQDIQSTISDGATGAIVSITRIARSTIPLPPSAAPGVPAEARPALGAVTALNIPRFTEPYPWQPVYGEQRYEYNASGEGGVYTEIPREILRYEGPSPEQLAAYNARRAEFFRPYLEQLGTTAQGQLAALTPAEVQAAMNAGILTPTGVAALIQAGFLPQIAATLSPELRAQIGELQTDAGGGVSVGLPAGIPAGAFDPSSLPPGTFSEATVQGLKAAFSFPGGSIIGLPSNNLSGLQTAIMTALGIGAMLSGYGMPATVVLGAIKGLLGAFNAITTAVEAHNFAQAYEALYGTGYAAPPTTDGLTFAQQLAFASQGVPFVADPTAPTGYSIDPTFGYIDAQGMPQGYHTAGNPSGLPTNPDSTNFGGVPGDATGGVVGDGTGAPGPGDSGGVQGP